MSQQVDNFLEYGLDLTQPYTPACEVRVVQDIYT
jgi:hypothetical protein